MVLGKTATVIFAALLILGICIAVYASGMFTQKAAIESPSEFAPEIEGENEFVTASTTEVDETSKDAAPAFVCDKGVSDPNPNIYSVATRELVIQALEKREHLLNNAPISCLRTYYRIGMVDDERGLEFLDSLTDEEFSFQLKVARYIMDEPDRTRMLHPDTEWEMRDNSSLVITEIVNGSSKGHWNPRYASGMWW